MILFVLFIILSLYTGVMTLNFFEKKVKLSHVIAFGFPVGLVIHVFIFSLFVYLRLDYNILLFSIVSLLSSLSLLKNKISIEIDIKGIPIYYIILLIILGIRLIQFSITGFVDFYNFDEFTAYQRNSYLLETFKDYYWFFPTYSPINIFLGAKTTEIFGLNVSLVRGFTPIFFILTSFFIYISLIKNNINKNISALISILFLFGSSELIILSKTFYSNIYFMYYFTTSIFLIFSHYHVEKKKGFPYLGLLLFVGFLYTRKDALLIGVVFIIFYMFVNFLKKRITLKQFIFILFSFGLIIFTFKISNTIAVRLHDNNSNVSSFLITKNAESYKEKFQIGNIKQFLKGLYGQIFSFGTYYFNWLTYLLFGISSFITIVMVFNKKIFKKYREIMFWSKFIQFAYIALVMLTEIFVFSVYEFTLAASFSRYTLGIIPIDYILLGMLFFGNNKIISDEFKKNHKVSYYIILFLIFALIPIFIEKFVFIREPFSIIRFGIIFIICEFIGFKVVYKD